MRDDADCRALPPLGADLLSTAATHPDAVHLEVASDHGSVIARHTYAQSAGIARAIAAALAALGVRPGDPVAVLGNATPREVQSVFGVWLAGAVLVPLDPQWSPEAHARALVKAQVRVGIALPGCVTALTEAATGIRDFRTLETDTIDPIIIHHDVALPTAAALSRALILFTSGTTGEPKAAVLSQHAIAWNARALVGLIGATAGDNFLNVLPLHHSFGLMASVVVPACTGARVTFPASLKGPDIAAAMRATGVTIVAAVPQLMMGFDRAIRARLGEGGRARRLLASSLVRTCGLLRDRFGFNLGRLVFRAVHQRLGGALRFLGSAGAALDPEVARRLRAVGLDLVEGYGLTEAGPALTFERGDQPIYGSVGYALAGVEIRIDQPDRDGVGEIVARSPSLFDGYLDDPDATREVLRDGWLYTGDLGRQDADGRLYITGRAKEVIVLGSGKNVYPQEVEARLLECPFVKELAVVGLRQDDRPGTEKLHAVVVPNLDALRAAAVTRIAVTLSDAIVALGDRLPSHHRVVGVTIRGEPLPRTPLGKLKRFQILKELSQGVAAAGALDTDLAPPASEHWPAVTAALAKVSDRRITITAATGLELDLGLDSLARVEALAALEQELGRRLPEGFGAEALTAGEVLQAIEELYQHGASTDAATTGDAFAKARGGWARRLGRPLGLLVIGVCYLPLVVAAKLLWRFRVYGRDQLPDGAFLICPNHGSYLDAGIIQLAIPLRTLVRTWALGDHEIFTNPVMHLLALFGNVIALDAGAGLRRTLDIGSGILNSGHPLILFPEGTRAPTGERLPFRRGAAMLARATTCPIVPTWLEGVDRMLPRGRARLRFGHRVWVRFGPPLDPTSVDGEPDPAAALTELLRRRVTDLGRAESHRLGHL